jgi:hypothetical protein
MSHRPPENNDDKKWMLLARNGISCNRNFREKGHNNISHDGSMGAKMRPMKYFFGVMLLFALLIRGGVLLISPAAFTADTDGYRHLAENLVEHGTFGTGETPTAYRPPLYPLLLTPCVALGEYGRTVIGALHVALGLGTVGLIWLLGRWCGLGHCCSALAALLVACDPILLGQSTQLMTETSAAFLTTAGLAALALAFRRQTIATALLAGGTLALGALCRPALLLWTFAVGVVLLLSSWHSVSSSTHPNSRRLTTSGSPSGPAKTTSKKIRLCTAYLLGVVIVLSPWVIRNRIQLGEPVVGTTHGGYTLLLANNPDFYQWLRSGSWGSVWQADDFNADWNQFKPQNELRADDAARFAAIQNMRDDPKTFAYACLVRIGRFWSPLPHQTSADESQRRQLFRWAVAVWYAVEYLLAAIGLKVFWQNNTEYKRANDEKSIHPSSFILHHCLLLVACLMFVHVFYWTDMRMRAPVMPAVALVAAMAFSTVARRKAKAP